MFYSMIEMINEEFKDLMIDVGEDCLKFLIYYKRFDIFIIFG